MHAKQKAKIGESFDSMQTKKRGYLGNTKSGQSKY